MNILLYAATVAIWGSTWLAIKFQIGLVPPVMSVVHRFALAAAILFVFCLLTGRRFRFPWRDHVYIALLGALLFGGGYIFCYLATAYITSGLLAVIFSLIQVMNVINLRLFFGQPIRPQAVIGTLFGLSGLGLIFINDLLAFQLTTGTKGMLLGVAGAYSASLGNIVAVRNNRRNIPIAQANALAMGWGAGLVLIGWLATGHPVTMNWSPDYLGPLVYLALFGSIIAFGCYLTLINRIGADLASYSAMVSPILAMTLSTLFEDFHWVWTAGLGIALALAGNAIILSRPGTKTGRRRALSGH